MNKKKSEWSSSDSDSHSLSSFTSDSRSHSLNSKSTHKSKDKQTSSRYSDKFSSESSDTDNKTQKTKNSNLSDTESVVSSKSVLSESNSFKNLIEENDPNEKLPTKVYNLLESLKKSKINIYNLKKSYKDNIVKVKQFNAQSYELIAINEKIADLMVQECLGCIALSQVIFGSSHWKFAMAYTELALIYLEFKNLPKQAKLHCETAWKILYEELKNKNLHEANKSEYQSNNFATVIPCLIHKHQMILNYIYGRACTLTKEYLKNKEYFLLITNDFKYLEMKTGSQFWKKLRNFTKTGLMICPK